MTEWQGRKREPITEDRLERAVAVLAQIVEEHGPSYGPLYESVRQELETFRNLKEATAAKAEPQQAPQPKRRKSA
jgi:hypothetical protein